VHACWDTYCNNEGYGGSSDYMQGSNLDLPYLGNDHNDKFSALRVYSIDPKTQSYTFFKKDCTYQGYGWVAQPALLNNFVNIFMNDLSVNHIGNDALSRVITGPLAAVTLYSDDNYLGSTLLLMGGDSSCLDSRGFNDITSSVRYYDLGSGQGFPKPVGSWVQRASGSSNQLVGPYALHWGYSTTDTTSTTSTIGLEMTTSIEAGTEFAKVDVSLSVSSSISNTVESAISKTSDVTCSAQCEINTCSSGITYLWNWNMAFRRPWESTASTIMDSCNWICTCTSAPPACPLNACANTVCSQCLPYQM